MNPIQMIQARRKEEEEKFYEPMKKKKAQEEKLRLMKETREYGIERYKAERKQLEEAKKTKEAFREEKTKIMKLRAEPFTTFLGKVREGIAKRKIKETKGIHKKKLGKGVESKPSSIFSLGSGSPSSIFELGSPKGVERESVNVETKQSGFDFSLKRPSLTGQRTKDKSYYRLGK